MSSPSKLRVFISSPGDVVEERVVTRRVLERATAVYGDRVAIEPVFWEHEPLRASASFQEQIPYPAECDLVLMILWSRLGTRLPAHLSRPDGSRYASGTEFEFENALEAYRAKGAPDLLVYRKTAQPVTPLDSEQKVLERLHQKKALDAFLEHWFMAEDGSLTAAFHTFEGLDDFEELLETHLRKLLEERLPSVEQQVHRRVDWTRGSPYRGLEIFRAEHAPIFFGRTRATSEILNALRRQSAAGRPFVLVLGMSGCGKSSLVRAGVLPLLTQPGVIEGVGLWRSAVMRPADAGSDLFTSLASALLKHRALPELTADGTGIDVLARLLQDSPDAAFALIKGGLSQAAAEVARKEDLEQQPVARLALVIDQLEELFTTPSVSSEQRDQFVAVIDSLVASGKIWVLATLRSDFYPRLMDSPGLVALKKDAGQYDLLPASAAEMSQMIRRPAELAGLKFEENEVTGERLDDALRDAAAQNPGALPLLQFALEQLYTARSGEGVLSLSAYDELGGVEGALAQRAEAAFKSLGKTEQAAFATVMSALVTVGTGEGDVGTRQRAPLAGFAKGSPGRVLIDRFVEARLLVTDRDDRGEPVVTVAHEALLRHWPRLEEWLEHNRELLQVRERLDAEARQWEAEGRPASNLLASAKRLAEANELEKAEALELPEHEHEFLQASLAKGQRTQRLKRVAVVTLFILAVVAAGAAFFAEGKRQEAEEARGEAEAVTGFLSDMLASVDPAELGREVLVRDVLDEASTKIDELEDQPLIQARLMNTMENVYVGLGLFEPALELAQGSLAIRESQLGPDHLDVAQSLNSLGEVHRHQGQYEEAELLYLRALDIREKKLGPDDPGVSAILNNLGMVMVATGDYAGALPLYERSLAIDERHFGPGSLEAAATLTNIAILHARAGRLDEARVLFERTLVMREEQLGQEHVLVADSMHNVGAIQKDSGNYKQALPMLSRTATLKEKLLGPDHASLAKTLKEQGAVYAALGDLDRARAPTERAIAISEKALGPDHPTVATDITALAIIIAKTGDIQAAKPLFERALRIRETALGPGHPDVALSLTNIGVMYRSEGDIEGARPYYERALEIYEAALEPDHPGLALPLNNLANLLTGLEQYEQARPLYERALSIREQALGPGHRDVGFSLFGLATLLGNTGEESEAEILIERAQAIWEEALGPEHPLVAAALEARAELMRATGREADAIELDSRVRAIRGTDTAEDVPPE